MDPTRPNHPNIEFRSVADLRPHPNNPRKVTKSQISAALKAIRDFGFNTPLLLDSENQVIAGHWRLEAARKIGLDEVPVLVIDHLSSAEVRAFQIAENRQVELGKWDEDALAQELSFLFHSELSFDLEATGFDLPEIEFRVDQAITLNEDEDPADELPVADDNRSHEYGVQPGDLWACGDHRIYCGDSLCQHSYDSLLELSSHDEGTALETVQLVLTDPPYNVAISGHVSTKRSGDGHREFAMASGEMSEREFDAFLTGFLGTATGYLSDGGLAYVFMDYAHIGQLLNAGKSLALKLLNIPIWAKHVGGMGSFYRSQHEMIALFKKGDDRHKNRVQLGKYGRNRTNVWSYPGIRLQGGTEADGEESQDQLAKLHPTVKPVAMLRDALLDSTDPGDLVLDPFGGSGSLILAAERTKRHARLIEIDPTYVEVALTRYERFTGDTPRLLKRGLATDPVGKTGDDANFDATVEPVSTADVRSSIAL